MADGGFSEVSHESWFSRIGNAFFGILIGLVMFLASFALLWWNEGRAVARARTLAEGKKAVVDIKPDQVLPENEGKLVHITGKADTEETLQDKKFAVSVPKVLQLIRVVEMYQYKEKIDTRTEKQLGGGKKTITTYTYPKVWSATPIDSSKFKKPENHNPPMPLRGQTWTAEKVNVGAFVLPTDLVKKIGDREPLPVTKEMYEKIPEELKEKYQRVEGGDLYSYSPDSPPTPNSPEVGDVRIKFKVLKPTTISLLAQQSDNTFRPYQTSAGGTIERIQSGDHSAEEMFESAEEENNMLTWVLRLVGWVVMGVGIYLVFNPLVVFADVLPFLGNLLSVGVILVAGLISLVLSLVTIALAWVFYRPIIGVSILVGAAAIGGLIWYLSSKKSAKPESA